MVQFRDALNAVDCSGVSLESGASGRRFAQHQASRVVARQVKVVPHAIDLGHRRARACSPMLCQQDGPGGSSAATWLVQRGAGGSTLKLESVKQPGHFLCWRDSEEVRNTSRVAGRAGGRAGGRGRHRAEGDHSVREVVGVGAPPHQRRHG
jgi:hypothetical protein